MGTGTNPLVSDTDGDGLTDSLEVALKLNPFSSDTDGDMLPDAWEMQHPGLNPKSSNSRTDDPDNDGLDTATEYVHGTDPFSSDTDGDNVSDGDEIAQGSNPLDESDHESAPSEDIVAVPFSLYGDYAAWDMNIQGLDDDTRAFTLTTLRPGRTETQTIPLRRGNAYRVTLSWRGSYPHINPYWYCWEAQMDGLPREPSFLDYHSYRLPGQNEIFGRTNVIVENTDGLFTSHIHTMDEEGGNIAQGRAAILHVLRASLVPDRNRDQVISIEDAETSSPLHVWINDDLDTGDISSKTSDIPGQTDQDTPNNSRDNRINGTSDLLDFFPVWVDASEAIEKIETLFGYSLYLTLRVRQEDSAVSWISTLLTTNTAGTYLTDTNFPYASAETRIASPEGSDCPPFFIEAIRNNPACGILLIEGRTESEKPLVVEIRYLDRVLCELSLPLQVHSVEERMEKVNLREGRAQLRSGWYEPPSNGAHVYFVHGFSIDEERNRGWNSEMYKRLWQSGCNARYHAIDWKGNEGLMDGSWHYQQNVANALGTAIDLKDYVNRQTGRKVVLAHSLGNMVVSRAISKYELEVDTYILLNAAVPVEAYDPTQFSTETNNVMVPLTWRGLTNLCWSAQYHSLFPEDDDRHDLTWKGYFANVPNLTTMINYHSGTNTEDGDEVLELFDEGPPSIFQGETISHYSWHKQEVNKGCGESANPASTDCAGWGMRDFGSTFANPNLYESTGIIWERVLEYMKRYPIFWPNPESILTNSIPMADHYTILAKGIPALSGPAGSRPFLEEPRVYNINMNLPNFKNGWPHTGDRYEDFLVRWLHSDIVAVSFLFTHPLFFDIMEKGNLK